MCMYKCTLYTEVCFLFSNAQEYLGTFKSICEHSRAFAGGTGLMTGGGTGLMTGGGTGLMTGGGTGLMTGGGTGLMTGVGMGW